MTRPVQVTPQDIANATRRSEASIRFQRVGDVISVK